MVQVAAIHIQRGAIGVRIGRVAVFIVVDEEVALRRLPDAELRRLASEGDLARREVRRVEHADLRAVEIHAVRVAL